MFARVGSHTHTNNAQDVLSGSRTNGNTESENAGGEHERAWRDSDRDRHRDNAKARGGWFNSMTNTRANSDMYANHTHANNEGKVGGGEGRDVRIMADIMSAPHTGSDYPESSNWSAPSAIEARMLGLTDTGAMVNGRRVSGYGIGGVGVGGGGLEGKDDEDTALQLPRNGALSSRLPQEIIDLILKLSRTHGRAQAAASERVRQLVHNKAVSGLIAKESWALDVMAQVIYIYVYNVYIYV